MNIITGLAVGFITLVTYTSAALSGEKNGAAVALLAAAIIFSACVMIAGIVERGGLLRVLFGVYFILGYIFPGMLHSASGAFPYFRIGYTDDTVFTAAVVVAVFTAATLLGTRFASLRPLGQSLAVPNVPIRQMRAVVIVVLCAAAMALVLLAGPSAFLRQRSDAFVVEVGSLATLLLLISIARSLPVIALCASIHRARIGGWSLTNVALFTLSLICVGITNFPLAVPRFVLIGVLISLLHLAADVSQPRFKFLFVTSIAAGVVTAFPLLSFLQRGQVGTTFEVDVLSYLSTSVDLDGFQSTANIVAVVDGTGLRWGWQLLSAVLFLVPRQIWPDKGMPTGSIGADYVGYPFNNISAPLPTEFYIDFGFVGCIIGGFLIGYYITRIDQSFSRSRLTLRYYLLIGSIAGFEVILSRGPLLGVIGPVVAQLALIYVSTITPFLSTVGPRDSREKRLGLNIGGRPKHRRL